MLAMSSALKVQDAYDVTEKTVSKDSFTCFPLHPSHSFLPNKHLFMLQDSAPIPPPQRHVL